MAGRFLGQAERSLRRAGGFICIASGLDDMSGNPLLHVTRGSKEGLKVIETE
jgi:hypothetical protein